MNSEQIQNSVYDWASEQKFTAPYGILKGQHTNKKGLKVKTVTFGYARTLDVTVEIYNRNFISVKTSSHGNVTCKGLDQTMDVLKTLV